MGEPQKYRSKPTEVDRLRARAEAAEAALLAIEAIHQPEYHPNGKPWVCRYCGVADGSWPCATRMETDAVVRRGQP